MIFSFYCKNHHMTIMWLSSRWINIFLVKNPSLAMFPQKSAEFLISIYMIYILFQITKTFIWACQFWRVKNLELKLSRETTPIEIILMLYNKLSLTYKNCSVRNHMISMKKLIYKRDFERINLSERNAKHLAKHDKSILSFTCIFFKTKNTIYIYKLIQILFKLRFNIKTLFYLYM